MSSFSLHAFLHRPIITIDGLDQQVDSKETCSEFCNVNRLGTDNETTTSPIIVTSIDSNSDVSKSNLLPVGFWIN